MKFVFNIVNCYHISKKLSLEIFLDDMIIQKIIYVLEARRVTPGRVYQILLLITKILLFLRAERNTNLDSLKSWTLLQTARKDAHIKESRRRAAKALAPPEQALNSDEIATLRHACLRWLEASITQTATYAMSRMYLAHLIGVTLLMIPTPRSQILSLLEVGRTFLWDAETQIYLLSFNGVDPPLKNRMPLLLTVPMLLTRFYKVAFNRFINFALGVDRRVSPSSGLQRQHIVP